MSINIQLDGKLQKISGQTMTKEKIVEKLGYTPAKEEEVGASLAALNSDIEAIEDKIENIDPDSSDDEFILADKQGNVIAKIDDEGLHTTSIEAESFTSNDKELAVYDDNGNAAFKVDENGITHAAKLELNSGDVDDQLSALSADIAEHASKTIEHVNSTDRARWDNKSDFSGKYSDLEDAPNIVEDESGNVSYVDKDGNIILKIDGAGVHTTKIELLSGDVDEQFSGVNAKIAEHVAKTDEHVTAEKKAEWDAKSNFSGEFKDLINSPISEDNSGELVYADEAGNIIFKVAQDGAHTTEVTLPGGKVDERLNQLSADLAAHTAEVNNNDSADPIHLKPGERAEWNAKATTKYVDDAVAGIVNSAPEALNTLNELATALGNDENFATTVTNELAKKATQADFAEHKADSVSHITAAERSTWNNKSDVKSYNDLPDAPDIAPEDNEDSLVITDSTGNIVLRAGELDEDTTGLETTTIRARVAAIDNVYTKTEIDAAIANAGYAITANAEDDDVVNLEGTGGNNAVSYKATHADSGVSAGTYKSVTVNAKGHITSGTNPNTLAGFGITDAYTDTEVDDKIAEHATATTAHTKSQVGLDKVDNTSDADKPISKDTQAALDALKEEIVTESDSWTVVDESGNILLKAGELDDNKVGLETTAIIADEAVIDNIYNKTEVDALVADHEYDISASASDDDIVILTGTGGKNSVSYSVSHKTYGTADKTYQSVTVDKYGHVKSGTNPTTLDGYGITDAYTKEDADAKIAEAIAAIPEADWVATSTSEPGETIYENTVSFTSSSAWNLNGYFAAPEYGAEVDVYWDGVKYQCTVKEFDEGPYIGNAKIAYADYSNFEDTGEPFAICGSVGVSKFVYICKSTSKAESISIKVTNRGSIVYNTLPEEYLPTTVVKTKDGKVICKEIASESEEFSICDEEGNVVAKIDDAGVAATSVAAKDFKLLVVDKSGNVVTDADGNPLTTGLIQIVTWSDED